jgi:hypothetical protein
MTERRYSDDEVAVILRAAAEGPETSPSSDSHADGLTLRELQSIAREVEISPDAVARAARSLDASPAPSSPPTLLGLPLGVQRTAALDRRLTDHEWELLVVKRRWVSRTRGTVRSQGSFREWSNGNLQVLLEPTPSGQQLRLSTVRGNTRASIAMGTLTIGLSVVVWATAVLHGALAGALPEVAALATVGTALVANSALRLPSWARRRRAQMDGIAERVSRMTQREP